MANEIAFQGSLFSSDFLHDSIRRLPDWSRLNDGDTDMASFASDFGYTRRDGEPKSPFVWDEERRMNLRGKLDAVYFHLYGITDRDDIAYIYSTFPIVEREESEEHGRYLSRDLCLAWMNALAAGDPDAEISI